MLLVNQFDLYHYAFHSSLFPLGYKQVRFLLLIDSIQIWSVKKTREETFILNTN